MGEKRKLKADRVSLFIMDMEAQPVARAEVKFRSLRISDYFAISIFWFGVSLHWAAFLSIIMQVRVAELVPAEQKGTYLAYLFAIGALISTVIELIAGPISDRCTSRMGRRRPFILWGTLLTLPFILLFMHTPYFWGLVFYFVMIQLFLNWANGPYQAVIPDQVPPERHGLASAYMGMMTLVGQAIGIALAGLSLGEHPILFKGYSYQGRLLILGGILSVILLVTMLWTVRGMKEKRWQPARPEEARVTFAHMFDLGTLKAHPDFLFLIISRFFFNLGFYNASTYIEYYMRDSMGVGADAPKYAFVLFEIAVISGVLGNWIAGVVSDRYSKKLVMYLCSLVLGTATFCFLLVHQLSLVYVLGVFFGMAWGAFAAVDWALASNLVPKKEAGRYMAIWHIAMTVPQVVAPLIAGPVGDLINRSQMGLGWRVIFTFVPVYLLIGVLFLHPIRERQVE